MLQTELVSVGFRKITKKTGGPQSIKEANNSQTQDFRVEFCFTPVLFYVEIFTVDTEAKGSKTCKIGAQMWI